MKVDWDEFLNIDLLKLALRHCSGSITVILLFEFTAWVARRVMHDVIVPGFVELIDKITSVRDKELFFELNVQ